jgi:hypothetical protein
MDSFYNSGFILKYQKDDFTMNWIVIIVVSIIVIFVVISNYTYNKCLTLDGIVIRAKEGYNINVYIKKDDIVNIFNKDLIVNKENINYTISNISNEYLIGQDKKIYKNIIIDGEIDKNIMIENNIIKLNWNIGKTTLMNEITNFIKKGLLEWNN